MRTGVTFVVLHMTAYTRWLTEACIADVAYTAADAAARQGSQELANPKRSLRM